MRKLLYLLLCAACFGGGAYVWKVKNTGISIGGAKDLVGPPRPAPSADLAPNSVIVEIGSERVTQEDVDWEYNLATDGVVDKDTMTPIPDLGNRYPIELQSLKKSLVGTVVERKLLFAYVQQDHEFQYDKASRYSTCLAEWQQTVEQPLPVLQGKGRDRLKARLCERSILDQYLKERLFSGIKVDDAAIVEYYKNHENEFRVPERVEIRQVLLGSEAEARRWRAQINSRNFSDIARNHSLAQEADEGGHLGPISNGALPTSIFEVAYRLKKGEISDVIKSNYGYHVVMLLNKWPKGVLSLDEARPKIASTLKRQKEDELYSRWVEKALAAVNVQAPKAAW